MENMSKEVDELEKKLNEFEQKFIILNENDVNNLAEIKGIKNSISSIKSDVSSMKSDIKSILSIVKKNKKKKK